LSLLLELGIDSGTNDDGDDNADSALEREVELSSIFNKSEIIMLAFLLASEYDEFGL
jgi:hypothetical protein